MTLTTYIFAWLIYLLAGIGLCSLLWKLSGHWRLELKYVSRSCLLIILFTPYYSDPEQSKFAPATLISLFEFVFGETTLAVKSLIPLLFILCIGATISLLYAFTQRKTK